jgi:hypothetical protein
MHNALTYADLDALLRQWGFAPVSTAGTQRVFENASLNAIIILPPYATNEPVRPHHLVTVRKTVVENGIIDEDAFERLMAERLLARA